MTTIRPQPGPQERFLASGADIVIYGGAAGGGKTWGLLAEPLRHINKAAFGAVIFRRTFPQIMNEGGLHDTAVDIYLPAGGEFTQPSSGVTWSFPSGARVRLTHLQHPKTVLNWQGAQIPLIAFDELTHFDAAQFWYLFSRNRSPVARVRPYIRAATNSEPGWVADLISWWIGADGYPIPERDGVLRWFIRYNERLVWADDPDDLTRKYKGARPKSLTFIRARLQDNPILMKRDPGYLANLMALPLVDRERLLHGNWLITPSAGKVFNRAWFQVIKPEDVPDGGVDVRFWDLAATAKELKGDDPDYTAGVKIRKVDGIYYVTDVIAVRLEPGPTDRLIRTTAERDREHARRTGATYKVRWEKEGGASGKRDNRSLVRLLDGFDASGVRPEGDKITRAKPFAVQTEQGFVCVVAAAWTDDYLTHMHQQPDWSHDDMMDASAGAFNAHHAPGLTSKQVDFYGEHPPEPDAPAAARTDQEIADALADYEARQQ